MTRISQCARLDERKGSQRDRTRLEVKVLQDLDERRLEPGDLEAVLDAADEADRVDLGADVLEQTADEACAREERVRKTQEGMRATGRDARGLVSE